MRKTIIAIIGVICAIAIMSCVDETGAGTPSPKQMMLESSEYEVNFSTDSVDVLNLRWIDVGNAKYEMFITNSYTNDTTFIDASTAEKAELSTMCMALPYTTLSGYIEAQGLFSEPSATSTSLIIGVTGKPADANKPSALSPEGTTVSAVITCYK